MSDKKTLLSAFGKKKQNLDEELKERINLEQQDLSKITTKEKQAILTRKILATTTLKKEEIDENAMDQLTLNLSTMDGLKSTYLNKDFKAVADYFKTIKSMRSKVPLTSIGDSNTGSNTIETIGEDEEIDDDLDIISKCKVNQKIKVKLIITEIAHEERDRNVRKILSPFASALGLSPRYGMFHSALVVGPWYLEWTDKSFCMPKKCFSQSAIIALDVHSLLETADCDYIIDCISEVIARWNVMREYDKHKNNCQSFIDDLLVSLGIDPNSKFSGQLGEYLSLLRKSGENRMIFWLTPSLREDLSVKESSITFETHKELDDFLTLISTKSAGYFQKNPHDEMLLKSFDRAFWLKYYRNQKIEGNQHLFNKHKECCCHFGDPKSTRSFGGDDWHIPQ
jgi:hypothetical protein